MAAPLPVLLTALLTFSVATAQPDWRAIPIETYPDASRADITKARDAALVSPTGASIGQLGLVLHAWEQFDLAAEAYAQARRLEPTHVDWWVFSGLLASRAADHATAADFFARAVTLAPSPLLQLRLADALLDGGRPDEARKAYERARADREAEPAARYGLGRVALAAGDIATARAEFERALAIVPTFGAAHYGLAQVQRKLGDLNGAQASLERQQACLTCWPMPNDPWSARLGAVRTDAATLLSQGVQVAGSPQDVVDAIALHERALARDGSLVQARVNLITLYARAGDIAKAEAQYHEVLRAATQAAQAHHAFGIALATAGDFEKAGPILRQAVHGNPLDAAAHNALGLIAEGARRPADAQAAYLRAIDADPRIRMFRFNYARLLTNTGRLADALAQLTRLSEPDDAESVRYVYATSAVYARSGDRAQARRLGLEALARARRHGALELAQVIERDLQKLQ